MSKGNKSWPSVTIAIPTFNGMGWLETSMPDFLEQEYDGRLEILLIDSGSTDGTEKLDQQHPEIRIHRIPAHEFGHGKTRNLATTLSTTDLILLTVQDASPRNSHWVMDMVEALKAHRLDAVCGGQAAPHRPDVNPLERYRPLSEPDEVNVVDGTNFSEWSKKEQLKQCGWDNVNALYNRDALLNQPFEDVRFGEDMQWAKSWLEKGESIGYAYHCKVWHHHHHHGDYTRKRELNTTYWRWKTFDILPESSLKPSITFGLLTLKRLVWNHRIFNPMKIWSWWLYNWKKANQKALASQEFARAFNRGPHNIEELYESLGNKSPMATIKS